MPGSPLSSVLPHLRRALGGQGDCERAPLTDGQLLESFVSHGEAMGLQVLVRRHGPMVWGVCRRILRNHHDIEDAFQATFLVLVRKAASIAPREMVGNWLYGVAQHTALRARATAAKRRLRQRQPAETPEPTIMDKDLGNDLAPLLDQELRQLPDKYRVIVVLCDLEGLSRKQAALQLGLPEGTVASRLARARSILAKRLGKHGLAVSGGALGLVFARSAAAQQVPITVLSATIRIVTQVAAGKAAAAAIPATVAALTEGVIQTMLITKLRTALTMVLAGLLLSGAIVVICQVEANPPEVLAVQKQKPAPTEQEKLQGTWEVVVLVKDGEKMLPADDLKGRIVVEGDKLRFILTPKGKDDFTRMSAAIKLDPSKSPKTIDATVAKGEVALGIYEVEGDNLKLCLTDPGEERPSGFKADKGDGSVLLLLKRAKQQESAALKPVKTVLGPKAFHEGDGIEITEVRATSANLEPGDSLIVRGRVQLGSRDSAEVLLSVTQNEDDRGAGDVEPSQLMQVKRGRGDFELKVTIKQRGALHVTFYDQAGKPFGGVYFGTAAQMNEIEHWSLDYYLEGAPQARTIASVVRWSGTVENAAKQKALAEPGLVTSQKTFADLWKTLRPAEEVPEVDFTSHFIVVHSAKGLSTMELRVDEKGDASLTVKGQQGGTGSGYGIAVFPRAAVKTFGQQPLQGN